MKSKTSFCNGTVLRKDLTRFAPAWILYTLCLILGLALMLASDTDNFWFANNMGELIHQSAIINLIYAPLVAMLLFGDLYNSRMCNALHAMPLKRGCWFGSHILAGLLFSLIPTALFCGLAVPALMSTCVVNSAWIALWTFFGMNLTYLCFFGIAVFSVFCAGNRFGMAAIYALLNGGACVAWFLVDTLYTPMLYGVVTPSLLVENLTPVYKLTQQACLELQSYHDLVELYGYDLRNAKADFWLLPEGWLNLSFWALVGIGFLVLGRLLYGKRKLECAGDAMAIKVLEPVFLICVSLCAAAFGNLFLQLFIGTYDENPLKFLFVSCGLLAGWFAGKMILERTVRVFRFKSWLGLAALTAVLAATIAMAQFDVFGIETWTPAAEDVQSVTFGYSDYRGMSEALTEKEDIEAVICLQKLALDDRLDAQQSRTCYYLDGEPCTEEMIEEKDLWEQVECRYAANLSIRYTMKNGRAVNRNYIIWCDGEEGRIVNEYLSRWEVVSNAAYYGEVAATAVGVIEPDKPYTGITIMGNSVDGKYCTPETVDSLLAAIRADCEDRTMTQRASFHTGHFEYLDEAGQRQQTRSFWIEFVDENARSGSFSVFADSENTLNWLKERDLLPYEVLPNNGHG